MKRALLDRLLRLRAEQRPVAVLTDIRSGAQSLVVDGEIEGDLQPSAEQLAAAIAALEADRSCLLPGAVELFLQAFSPPLRLVIVGAVHIAQVLGPMAVALGYRVLVVDPRRAWATRERFPELTVVTDWPDTALAGLALDQRSAVVTLSHDPKLDDPALEIALKSTAFYIGALGSRKTHAKRIDRLRARGLPESALARIHGPAGLALGGRGPGEIAVSILAQMTQVLHGTPPVAPGSATDDLRTDAAG